MRSAWLAVAVALGCGQPPQQCNAVWCAKGCCDSYGQCQTGDSVEHCGRVGNACVSCQGERRCVAGRCVMPIDAGSGDSGRIDGGLDAGMDAGPDARMDAGIDGAVDAGIDAGADAGIDAGVDAGIDAGADAGIDAGVDTGIDAGADAGIDTGADAGIDVGVDAGIDAGADAGSDAGVDAGIDAGVDAGIDAGVDAGIDAGADAGIDAGADAGIDAGADAGIDGGNDVEDAGVRECRVMTAFPVVDGLAGYERTPDGGREHAVGFVVNSSMAPYDVLEIDAYWAFNGTATALVVPSVRNLAVEPNYSICTTCVVFRESCYDFDSCNRTYLARAGTVHLIDVSRAPSGTFHASLSDVEFHEWKLGQDIPVVDGGCIRLNSATIRLMR